MAHEQTGTQAGEKATGSSVINLRQAVTATLFVLGLGAILDMEEPTLFLVVWVVLYALVAGKPAARTDRGSGTSAGAGLGIALGVMVVVLAVYAGARALFTTMELGMPSTLAGAVAAAVLALTAGVTAMLRK